MNNEISNAYFIHPVSIRSSSTTRTEHHISSSRAKLVLKTNYLLIDVEGFETLVPLTNISALFMAREPKTDKIKELK